LDQNAGATVPDDDDTTSIDSGDNGRVKPPHPPRVILGNWRN